MAARFVSICTFRRENAALLDKAFSMEWTLVCTSYNLRRLHRLTQGKIPFPTPSAN